MTKHLENGDLVRVHLWFNAEDYALIRRISRAAKPRISSGELIRELLSNALRGLRPGQITSYDRVLRRDMQKAQQHLDRALRRINVPKQGTTILVKENS